MNRITFFFLLMISLNSLAQKTDKLLLQKLMNQHPELFSKVLNHPNKNQVQLLYTQVIKNNNLPPRFKSYSFNLDNHRYFYPASTVKLAAVIFALEKVNELNIDGLTAQSTMLTDSAYARQTKVTKDNSAKNGLPSITHYIKKILLTSDNDAFNRLFEFIGPAEINAKLKKHGLKDSRILNRLAIGDSGESAKHTNPIRFYKEGQLLYSQPAQYDPMEYPLKLSNLLMGSGYLDNQEKLVNMPFDMANKNTFSIADQQTMMRKLIYPEAFPAKQRFNLKSADYQLIYKYMSILPTQSECPVYDSSEFWPVYAKMLYYGREKNAILNPHLTIFNKYGDSYGFIIDNAYFKDSKNNIEFFLTAVIQSNEDGIYNDNKYEYESICYPFMKNIGRVIYEYELKRKKK